VSPKLIVGLLGATLLSAAYVAATMVAGGDRRMLLIGETTDAHHQIEMACETCHAAAPFASTAAAEKALNRTCLGCHEAELKAAGDSHPRKTFRNPRMAAFRERLDARLCTSCHVEHHPEITRAGAVTVAMDFCVACHSGGEQDVRRNRPSHAAAGVNCAACHAADLAADAAPAEIAAHWVEAPSMEVCGSCHKPQARSFAEGRHGMRGHPRVARPRDPALGLEKIGLAGVVPEAVADWLADPVPPVRMTVGEARLAMRRDDDPHLGLDCGTCHRSHDVDTARAAVQACASCHDDPHTRAYFGSPHHLLWQAERNGAAPAWPARPATCPGRSGAESLPPTTTRTKRCVRTRR